MLLKHGTGALASCTGVAAQQGRAQRPAGPSSGHGRWRRGADPTDVQVPSQPRRQAPHHRGFRQGQGAQPRRERGRLNLLPPQRRATLGPAAEGRTEAAAVTQPSRTLSVEESRHRGGGTTATSPGRCNGRARTGRDAPRRERRRRQRLPAPARHRGPPPPRGAVHWPVPTLSAPLIRGGPCLSGRGCGPGSHCRGEGAPRCR